MGRQLATLPLHALHVFMAPKHKESFQTVILKHATHQQSIHVWSYYNAVYFVIVHSTCVHNKTLKNITLYN